MSGRATIMRFQTYLGDLYNNYLYAGHLDLFLMKISLKIRAGVPTHFHSGGFNGVPDADVSKAINGEMALSKNYWPKPNRF